MKIGFDYWQVISHYPEQIYILLSSLEMNAYDTHIISAVGEQRVGTVAKEIKKIKQFSHFSDRYLNEHVHEVVFDSPIQSPELKLAKCKELGIEIFFDDRDDVCRLLNKNGILALRVTRRDNSTYDLDAERK
jgi:acid phosphatase class B